MGRFHDIEVEDNVTAYMEFPNGGTGTFISTTGEAPGTSRLEIAGEMGKLLLENDTLLFYRNEISMFQHSKKFAPRISKAGSLENRDSHFIRTRPARRADAKFC